MATREELLALLLSRRRGLSIRPLMPGHSEDWNRWLADDSRLQAALSPELETLVAQMAARPLRAPPRTAAPASRWAQFRALFKQGWGDEGKEPRGLHYGALTASVLFNVLFAALLVWLMYLRFLALQAPEEETVRIQITGFGTPDSPGGGGEPAQGDVQPAASAAAAAPAGRTASASTSPPAAATPAQPAAAAPVEADQPLQVSENKVAEQSDFQLPPARELAMKTPPSVSLRTAPVPSETEIPEALPEVRAVTLPTRPQVVQVPVLQPAERELTTPPEPAPQVRIRDVQARASGAALSVPQVAAGRALPTKQGEGDAAASSTLAATGGASRTPSSTTPGLPGARGQAPNPGQNAAGSGVGPAQRTAQGGWPSPRRDDDWGAGNSNRAGAATGGDRGNPRGQGGQGGSGLFNPDGSPRLADDSFKPRFPDPYKEGTWLKRPSLGYRGTMFDGIWRPPETLLQEWVRKGVKTVDIPLPGGKVKIRCIVSTLQAAGGCFPVAGKEGVHDQPAIARPPPAVPFKPHLIENPGDLTSPPPGASGTPPAAKEEDAKPATQP